MLLSRVFNLSLASYPWFQNSATEIAHQAVRLPRSLGGHPPSSTTRAKGRSAGIASKPAVIVEYRRRLGPTPPHNMSTGQRMRAPTLTRALSGFLATV